MEYLARVARERKENFLGIEVVITDDGPKFNVTWPDDPLVAQRLFTELEYQYKSRAIDMTAQQRDLIREAQAKQVQVADAGALAALNGKHKRS